MMKHERKNIGGLFRPRFRPSFDDQLVSEMKSYIDLMISKYHIP